MLSNRQLLRRSILVENEKIQGSNNTTRDKSYINVANTFGGERLDIMQSIPSKGKSTVSNYTLPDKHLSLLNYGADSSENFDSQKKVSKNIKIKDNSHESSFFIFNKLPHFPQGIEMPPSYNDSSVTANELATEAAASESLSGLSDESSELDFIMESESNSTEDSQDSPQLEQVSSEKELCVEIKRNHVTFYEAVKVVLIPKVDEYHSAGLAEDIWWTSEDIVWFRRIARQERASSAGDDRQ